MCPARSSGAAKSIGLKCGLRGLHIRRRDSDEADGKVPGRDEAEIQSGRCSPRATGVSAAAESFCHVRESTGSLTPVANISGVSVTICPSGIRAASYCRQIAGYELERVAFLHREAEWAWNGQHGLQTKFRGATRGKRKRGRLCRVRTSSMS